MALETVVGQQTNALASTLLLDAARHLDIDGTLYLGYPVIAGIDEPLFIDALLVSLSHGVVVFDFLHPDDLPVDLDLSARHDQIAVLIEQQLVANPKLRLGRRLAIPVNVLTFLPDANGLVANTAIATPENIPDRVAQYPGIDMGHLIEINASVQRITTMKPQRKRSSVRTPTSRGSQIKEIERHTANLDRWQKRAAIETPDGLQRIRGLAGSGKTIVLALKAAYLHARHPDWRIALTFHTRSLYQQLRDLLRRFTFEQTHDEPNWERLQLIHSWGGRTSPGFYSMVAGFAGAPVRDLQEARVLSAGRREHEFEAICQELVDYIVTSGVGVPHFDVLLIDEAQDLPRPFFELAYLATKDPHRIAYAYDELQNLSVNRMAPPSELFGSVDGRPRLDDNLTNEPGRPREDIVLPVCYRNTPWALTIAHALGFGIYRKPRMVQFFTDPELWEEIGYEVVSGRIAPGTQVTLRRRGDATPDYFGRLLSPDDAFSDHQFANAEEQAVWVADQIAQNLNRDELEAQDILVILTDPKTVQGEAAPIMSALASRGINAHIAGVTSSRDQLYVEDSIAISGIYRAKGNEAPMVYVLNSQYGEQPFGQIRRRNTLFTAFTRSRAWVRACGVGPGMSALIEEIDQVRRRGFQLEFRVPTDEELQKMRQIHRDRPRVVETQVAEELRGFENILARIETGDIDQDNLDPELVRKARELFGSVDDHDDG